MLKFDFRSHDPEGPQLQIRYHDGFWRFVYTEKFSETLHLSRDLVKELREMSFKAYNFATIDCFGIFVRVDAAEMVAIDKHTGNIVKIQSPEDWVKLAIVMALKVFDEDSLTAEEKSLLLTTLGAQNLEILFP